MKDRFVITISDVNGVRHFSLRHIVWRVVLIFIIVLIMVGIVGGFFIYTLNKEVNTLEARKVALQKELTEQKLRLQRQFQQQVAALEESLKKKEAENAALEKAILRKEMELTQRSQILESLKNEVEDLRTVLGAEEAHDLPLTEQIKKVVLTAVEIKMLLRLVPNGRPVKYYRGVSSPYGWRKHPIYHDRRLHKGIDYKGKWGDPIIATADGVVEYAGNKANGYGKMVIINHGFGFKTLYGHLSAIKVRKGQVIHKGQVIGKMGSSGRSTGTHLHYEVTFVQKVINPKYFVKLNLENYKTVFKEVRQVPWHSLASQVKKYVQLVQGQQSSRRAVSYRGH